MRPGQNKRMRGRSNSNNNNRKGPNPLTRSYESNGPDVKIRGTAHHVGEKYLQLARDAHSSGDPVRAESYLQHAEHYFRVIAAAQQAQHAQHGYGRQPGDVDLDDDEDGDDGSMPDRFASPTERQVQQPFGERPPFQNGGNGGHNQAHGQAHGQANGVERGQPYGNQHYGQNHAQSQAHGERGQGERGYDNRNGRSYDNRGYQDRAQHDRGYQNNAQSGAGGQGQGGQNGYDRGNGMRAESNRNEGVRNEGMRGEGERGSTDRGGSFDRSGQQDRQMRDGPRDFDRQRGPRPPRPVTDARQPVAEEPVGLPAFITAPTRPLPDQGAAPTEAADQAAMPSPAGEDGGFQRPRRRRRGKADYADRPEVGAAADAGAEAYPTEPASSGPVDGD